MADPPADDRLDAQRDRLLRALTAADVEFVVIGGAAIQTHGVEYRTFDIDATPRRSPENLQRLADVLNSMSCKLVIDPDDERQDVAVPRGYFEPGNLAIQDVWNLRTEHGKVDITFRPSGFPAGYDDLRERAEPLQVAQTTVTAPVAALADVEHSKRIADRPKDRDYLTRVGRLQEPGSPHVSESEPAELQRLQRAYAPQPPTLGQQTAATPDSRPRRAAPERDTDLER